VAEKTKQISIFAAIPKILRPSILEFQDRSNNYHNRFTNGQRTIRRSAINLFYLYDCHITRFSISAPKVVTSGSQKFDNKNNSTAGAESNA
jgi:hypothetical protein